MQLVLRLISTLVVISLFGVMAFAAWMQDHLSDLIGDGDDTAASAVVEEDGFQLTLEGVTISAASGVAPAGTLVRAKVIDHFQPEAFNGFAEPIGGGLEIVLGDNLQPASPVTIVFAADEASEWILAPDYGRESLLVVLASRDGGRGAELADAQLQPDGSVVVTSDHLSLFQRVRASIDRFTNWFGEQVLITLQARSERPACVGHQDDAPGWNFTPIPRQYLWTCADESKDGLTATFTNNSAVVWFVESDQATPGLPFVTSSTSLLVSAVAMQVIDRRTTAALAPPDASVTFTSGAPEGEIVFHASLNQPLTLTGAIWNAASSFLPTSKVERIVRKVGQGDCFASIVKTAIESAESVGGGFVATVTSCMGSLIEGTSGALFSSVTSVPAMAVASGTIAHAALSGEDHFSITLSKDSEPTATPTKTPVTTATSASKEEESAWPTKRNDNPKGLYTWLGANFFNLPDWSACDDAATWCLVGYSGESHIVIKMSGLDVIGEIPDSASDPGQELLDLGVPADSVDEILRP